MVNFDRTLSLNTTNHSWCCTLKQAENVCLNDFIYQQEEKTMTPHINAPEGAFADVVLMPGDPLRAKYIAETFLEDERSD